jgi:DNA-binding response OmpR family regulator
MRRQHGRAVNRIGPVHSRWTWDGRSAAATRRWTDLVFALLQLMERAGQIVRREHLENSIYGLDNVVGRGALEVLVHSLRRKLGADTVRTVRGFGYMLPREPQ